MLYYPRITGWGMYIPQRILTNQELAGVIDTSDAWIRARTGIRERRIAGDHETASTMGIEAGRHAIAVAGILPEDLELVIAATVTPEQIFPSCASRVQHGLGAQKAAAFDLNAACSGFVYALVTACQFIASGAYKKVLVIGSEVYSRILDWRDRSTCVLFGDGAGAVVLEASSEPAGPLSFVLGSDGGGADLLYVPGICGAPASSVSDGHCYLHMNGQEVFRFAVTTVCEATRQAVAAAGIGIEDIDLFIPHQANRRIIQAVARNLGLASEKVFINVERYGNTSAASIPIALCEAVEQGRLKAGHNVVLVGFGGGLTWAAMVLQWAASPTRAAIRDKSL